MRDYVQQLTVEQFGGMVPTATRTVGSGRGPYLGYTPTGAPLPVRFDATQAPREDRASGVLLIGTLGSGKTVAAQAIEYAAQRRGSLVVDELDGGPFPISFGNNIPHWIFVLPIREFEARLRTARHWYYEFLAKTEHPDIDINWPYVFSVLDYS